MPTPLIPHHERELLELLCGSIATPSCSLVESPSLLAHRCGWRYLRHHWGHHHSRRLSADSAAAERLRWRRRWEWRWGLLALLYPRVRSPIHRLPELLSILQRPVGSVLGCRLVLDTIRLNGMLWLSI